MTKMALQHRSENIYLDQVKNDGRALVIDCSRCFFAGNDAVCHYRGLLRQCVSLGALILTIIAVKIATPYATDFIKPIL